MDLYAKSQVSSKASQKIQNQQQQPSKKQLQTKVQSCNNIWAKIKATHLKLTVDDKHQKKHITRHILNFNTPAKSFFLSYQM